MKSKKPKPAKRRTVKTSVAFSPEFAKRLPAAVKKFKFKSVSDMIEVLFTAYFDQHGLGHAKAPK
jgi:hypothetical protein